MVFRAQGDGADQFFLNEIGGHRHQRIPDNEKRGRVHTSTITVATLPEVSVVSVRVRDGELEWTTCRGSGPGGQHINKTESAVQVTHIPTGIQVRCESERSQPQNKRTALAMLMAKLKKIEYEKQHGNRAADRKQQVGSGMRGDKRRTVAWQRGTVVDHVTGKSWNLKAYLRGDWD